MTTNSKQDPHTANIWALTGKSMTLMTLVGAFAGPALHVSIGVAEYNIPLKDIKAYDIARSAQMGVEKMAPAGLLISGMNAGLVLLARRKVKKEKEGIPQP